MSGRVYSDAVGKGLSLDSLQGQELHLCRVENKVVVNGANVIEADVEASNGVIHVIDAVLLPE